MRRLTATDEHHPLVGGLLQRNHQFRAAQIRVSQ